jgi:hypothetical protein
MHTQRLALMFDDLQTLWETMGTPAFCVSPGDLIETCALENYTLARTTLEAQLGAVPFYPGVGNHEYFGPHGEDPTRMADTFTSAWGKPLRYSWIAGNIVCIMLDYPDPHTLADPKYVFISQETLAFLDETLAEHTDKQAVIFLHCPLRNTVLDRDPAQHLDYNSLQHFFAPENSQEVRDILARHRHANLFFSGHTHSGWEAPNLVVTEQLGDHPVTFVNLMSPWYTGNPSGPQWSEDKQTLTFIPDDPDVVCTFAIRVYRDHASIRVRDHCTRRWLKEWTVPLGPVNDGDGAREYARW